MEDGRVSDIEAAAVARTGGPKAATYGEITPKGFASLATRLELGPTRHFADLGSGCGRAVLQAAEQYGVASACGIELSPSRHARALKAREAAPPSVASRVTFVHADMLAADVWDATGPLAGVTDVYLSSLCFSAEAVSAVGRRLSASRSVRRVASLRRFAAGLEGFDEVGEPEPCEMSWSVGLLVAGAEAAWEHQGVPVHVYRRVGAE